MQQTRYYKMLRT